MSTQYGTATTADQFHLKFGSNWIGDWCETFRTAFSRATGIAKRHNLWATTGLLDGTDVALFWTFTFKIYSEETDLRAMIDAACASSEQVGTTPEALGLYYDATDLFVNFGNCYLDAYRPLSPEELIGHTASMIEYVFLGTTKPVTYDVLP
jgi:hypothetical protein